jgi:type I restriction enzyme S subunit
VHDAPLAKAPGLILGRKGQGPLGVEWCEKDFWVIDTAYYASTLTPDVDLKYLYHLVKYVGLNHLKDGTSNPTLSRASFGAQLFPLPPLAEQKAIAAVLGALDDKIELNRRMNSTLEAMARALFQSWFVDFDPVRAKLDGRPPAALDPATAALFPDSFQYSPLGHIPTGWEAIPLYNTAQWVNGAAFKNEDFCAAGEGLPVIKIAELKDGISSQTKWCQRDAAPDKIIDTGDLVYSWSGSPDTSLEAFLWSGGRGLLNQHIFKVISATETEKRFVYYLLQYLRPVLVETARNKQTTGLGHVTIADMKRLLVCMPSKAVLVAFDRNVAPIFNKAFTNTLESRTLATLRDTLLPKLLSGELSVTPEN